MVNVTLLWGRVLHQRIAYQAIAVSETQAWSFSNKYQKTQVKAVTTLPLATAPSEQVRQELAVTAQQVHMLLYVHDIVGAAD